MSYAMIKYHHQVRDGHQKREPRTLLQHTMCVYYRVLHKSALFLNPGLKQIFTRLATIYQDYTIYNLD